MIKSRAVLESEGHAKIARIRSRLDEIRQYKRILAEEGLQPDRADKELESELIVRLLRLEKDLGLRPAKARPGQGKPSAAPAKAQGARRGEARKSGGGRGPAGGDRKPAAAGQRKPASGAHRPSAAGGDKRKAAPSGKGTPPRAGAPRRGPRGRS
jgi:hypothetical protein